MLRRAEALEETSGQMLIDPTVGVELGGEVSGTGSVGSNVQPFTGGDDMAKARKHQENSHVESLLLLSTDTRCILHTHVHVFMI